jgi:hypothetical protein
MYCFRGFFKWCARQSSISMVHDGVFCRFFSHNIDLSFLISINHLVHSMAIVLSECFRRKTAFGWWDAVASMLDVTRCTQFYTYCTYTLGTEFVSPQPPPSATSKVDSWVESQDGASLGPIILSLFLASLPLTEDPKGSLCQRHAWNGSGACAPFRYYQVRSRCTIDLWWRDRQHASRIIDLIDGGGQHLGWSGP